MGVRTRENEPKYSPAEILTEILIGLNEELMEIYVYGLLKKDSEEKESQHSLLKDFLKYYC